MSFSDPIEEFVIGETAKLGVVFRDESGQKADPNVNIQLIIIDHDNVEQLNIIEPIGALVQIQREGSVGEGAFFYRHFVVSGDSTRNETWKYKYKTVSSGGAIAATGSITTVGPLSYMDGQAFTLDDGVNAPTRFEFDNNSIVQVGSVIIDLTAAINADALAALIRSAINASPALDITASGIDPVVDLVNDVAGTSGNTPMLLEGDPPGSYSGMGGGKSVAPTTASRPKSFRVLKSDFPNP